MGEIKGLVDWCGSWRRTNQSAIWTGILEVDAWSATFGSHITPL